ncbi:MAG: hypothetical protein ACOY3M_00840 [Patescibacteria group bacterium]
MKQKNSFLIVILATKRIEDHPKVLQEQMSALATVGRIVYVCRCETNFLVAVAKFLRKRVSDNYGKPGRCPDVTRLYVYSPLPFLRFAFVRRIHTLLYDFVAVWSTRWWLLSEKPLAHAVWMMHTDLYKYLHVWQKSILIIDTIDHDKDKDKHGIFMKRYRTTGIFIHKKGVPTLAVVPWGATQQERIKKTIAKITEMMNLSVSSP